MSYADRCEAGLPEVLSLPDPIGTVRTIGYELDALSAELVPLRLQLDVRTATGTWLDRYGAFLRTMRHSLDDDTYRALVMVRAVTRRGFGNPSDITALLGVFGFVVLLRDVWSRNVLVEVESWPTILANTSPAVIVGFFEEALPLGAALSLVVRQYSDGRGQLIVASEDFEEPDGVGFEEDGTVGGRIALLIERI